MSSPSPAIVFDKERAAAYDKRFEKMAPMKDNLHLLMRITLSELPEDANILCVGAGTGAEIHYLAECYPKWRFTAVEPAPAMLDICRQRAEENGISARCTFHEGYVDSLPASEPFDAATSLLVSHFILQQDERIDYFKQIAHRLRPGGYLISSDLVYDQSSPEYTSLFDTWIRMLQYSDMPPEKAQEYSNALKKDVAVLSPDAIKSILASAGFDLPVQFYQSLLIHGFYARKAA